MGNCRHWIYKSRKLLGLLSTQNTIIEWLKRSTRVEIIRLLSTMTHEGYIAQNLQEQKIIRFVVNLLFKKFLQALDLQEQKLLGCCQLLSDPGTSTSSTRVEIIRLLSTPCHRCFPPDLQEQKIIRLLSTLKKKSRMCTPSTRVENYQVVVNITILYYDLLIYKSRNYQVVVNREPLRLQHKSTRVEIIRLLSTLSSATPIAANLQEQKIIRLLSTLQSSVNHSGSTRVEIIRLFVNSSIFCKIIRDLQEQKIIRLLSTYRTRKPTKFSIYKSRNYQVVVNIHFSNSVGMLSTRVEIIRLLSTPLATTLDLKISTRVEIIRLFVNPSPAGLSYAHIYKSRKLLGCCQRARRQRRDTAYLQEQKLLGCCQQKMRISKRCTSTRVENYQVVVNI